MPTNRKPSVAVSVLGRFHAFELAQSLVARGALAQLLTTHPRFSVKRFAIPSSLVSSFTAHEAAMRLWRRVPGASRVNSQLFFANLYDAWAKSHLRDGADLLVAWSGCAEATMARARAFGMTTIVERGSCHIALQTELLSEEFARFGLRFDQTHPGVVEKEMREYEACDFISIPSSFVRRSFVERGIPAAKLIQVPYGVDLSLFHPMPRQSQTFRVVFAGALTLQKGFHYLVEGFSALKLPDAELVFLGTVAPEAAPVLARFPDERIRVLGPQKQSELKRFFSEADLFCLPSIQDGFGMVMAQAMACGLPVLTTTNTGGEDLFAEGKEGFIVPIRDARALGEKIRWCYEHREATRAMGEAARARILEGFDWDSYGERVYSEYHRVFELTRQ